MSDRDLRMVINGLQAAANCAAKSRGVVEDCTWPAQLVGPAREVADRLDFMVARLDALARDVEMLNALRRSMLRQSGARKETNYEHRR